MDGIDGGVRTKLNGTVAAVIKNGAAMHLLPACALAALNPLLRNTFPSPSNHPSSSTQTRLAFLWNEVKRNLSRSPTSLFNVGVRSQSARAAWLVRVQIARAFRIWTLNHHESRAGIGTGLPGRVTGSLPDEASGVGILDEIEAVLSSHQTREPSFYLGLVRPMLLLVLRGGIVKRGTPKIVPKSRCDRILSLKPISSLTWC